MKPFPLHRPGLLVPVALCAALALPVTGQVLNTETETVTPDGASQAEAPAAGPSFSQITRIYDNWSLQCRERAGEGECFVETVVRQNKPRVRDVIVLRFAQGKGGIETTIVTPNRVKLDRGVILGVGDQAMTAAYAICGPVNCNATLPARTELGDLLKANTEVSVSFHVFAPAEKGGEREIRIPISLAGYAAAFDHLVVFDAGE